jgi:glycosyltransferase involved in cell wall biosynthesis
MRILVASRGVLPITDGCGGAEIVGYELAVSMADAGHDVTLVGDVRRSSRSSHVTVRQTRNPASRVARFVPDGLLRWFVLHLFGNIAIARAVRRTIRDAADGFDVIHAHGALATILLGILVRDMQIVYTEHDATPWSCRYRRLPERTIRKVIYRLLNVAAFRRADRVVMLFASQREEAVRRWRIDGRKVAVIPNGTDPAVFDPVSDEPLALDLERYCLFVGSLVARKSPDLLLDAIADLDGVPCVFAGDGPMRAKLERRALELGISDRVRFLGAIPPAELAAVYGRADVLVIPAVSEASPLVAVEAMSCGLPVIASRISGLPSLVKDWDTGFLVKPGDVGQLAMAMTFLRGDDALRDRMGRSARRLVLRDFEWAAIARRYLDVYGSSLGRDDGAGATVDVIAPAVEVIDARDTAVAV